MSSRKTSINTSLGKRVSLELRSTGALESAPGSIIKIKYLTKLYPLFKKPSHRLWQFLTFGKIKLFKEFRALRNINLEINKGETVAFIGVNGSGKSTLLQIIAGTLNQSSGNIEVRGKVSALLELGSGFNPEFTGRENVFLNAAILGLSRAEISAKYNEIVNFSGLPPERLEQPVKTYSSGMYVRLAFAVAVASEPDILIIDEALSVGDEAFQRKSFARIREIKEKGGTIIMVSHSAQHVIDLCDRAFLLDSGEIILSGEPKKVVQNYHKLIFAAGNKRQEIREKIKNGLLEKDNAGIFSENLNSESQVFYEPQGAEIFDISLRNSKGQKTNLLTRGSKYKFSYKVKFSAIAENVKFGMLIKTITGVELGGASTAVEKDAIKRINQGELREVSFIFTANLLPGTYFFNSGTSAIIKGERTFLHRITDAYMFKLLPEASLKETGMVDFIISSKVKKIKNARKTKKSSKVKN